MIGIYFSGTGNTKYCLEKFVALYDRNIEITPLEDEGTIEKVKHHKDIIFAYPIYYGNLPKIVRDFICENSDAWKGKHIFIIATMGLFSGDGAGVSARLFKRYGAHIWGGLHLKMPDCICDVKALKHTPDQNKQIVIQAEECIKSAVYNLKNGTPTKNGLSFWCHIAGLLGQRLWFYRKTQAYSDKIQINANRKLFSLMTNIQDEVHRFSLSFQQQTHKKKTYELELTKIKGIGEAKALALIKHFKTKQALKDASPDEIASVAKVKEEKAKEIYDFIKENF